MRTILILSFLALAALSLKQPAVYVSQSVDSADGAVIAPLHSFKGNDPVRKSGTGPAISDILQTALAGGHEGIFSTVVLSSDRDSKVRLTSSLADNEMELDLRAGTMRAVSLMGAPNRASAGRCVYAIKDAASNSVIERVERSVGFLHGGVVYVLGNGHGLSLTGLEKALGLTFRYVEDEVLLDYAMLSKCDILLVTEVSDGLKAAHENIKKFVEGGGSVLYVPASSSDYSPDFLAAAARVAPAGTPQTTGAGSSVETSPVSSRVLVILLIDTSGSMVGENIDMARKSAFAASLTLDTNAMLSIIGFAGSPYVVMRPGPPVRHVVEEAVSRLAAAGATNIYNALLAAREVASSVKAGIKHVILFSDGVTPPADFMEIMRKFAKDGITLSTVCLAEDEFDWGLMQQLAKEGNGRSFMCWDRSELPQIFTRETRLAAKGDGGGGDSVPATGGEFGVFARLPLPFLEGVAIEGIKVPASVELAAAAGSSSVMGRTGGHSDFLVMRRLGAGKSCALALKPGELDHLLFAGGEFPTLFAYLMEFLRRPPLEFSYSVEDASGARLLRVNTPGIEIKNLTPLDSDKRLFMVPNDVTSVTVASGEVVKEVPLPPQRSTAGRAVELRLASAFRKLVDLSAVLAVAALFVMTLLIARRRP